MDEEFNKMSGGQNSPEETNNISKVDEPVQQPNVPVVGQGTDSSFSYSNDINIAEPLPEMRREVLKNFLESNDRRKFFFRVLLIIIFVLSVGFNGVVAYYYSNKNKQYKEQKIIVESKSNCPICPKVECPVVSSDTTCASNDTSATSAAPSTSNSSNPTTSTKKSTASKSTTSQNSSPAPTETIAAPEEVLVPPAPPAD